MSSLLNTASVINSPPPADQTPIRLSGATFPVGAAGNLCPCVRGYMSKTNGNQKQYSRTTRALKTRRVRKLEVLQYVFLCVCAGRLSVADWNTTALRSKSDTF